MQPIEEELDYGHRMALGGRRILRRLCWPRATLRQPARGGLIVDWTLIAAFVVTAGLVVYLSAALLMPEKFS